MTTNPTEGEMEREEGHGIAKGTQPMTEEEIESLAWQLHGKFGIQCSMIELASWRPIARAAVKILDAHRREKGYVGISQLIEAAEPIAQICEREDRLRVSRMRDDETMPIRFSPMSPRC